MAYSADRKPGELTALTSLATDDVFVVGDTSDASEVAKGITKANLITDLNASLTPALAATVTTNANLTGHVTSVGNAAVLGSFTKAQLTAAVSDGDPLYVGDVVGLSDGDKGDITVSATGATWTIDSSAVTLAKIANIATARLLGRTTAGSGVVEELTSADSFVSAASDTTAGKVELATTAETNTGTDTARAVTPDGLAGSYAGTKSLSVQVFDGTTDVATGDGKAYITIPEALNGMNLIRAQATVVTAGTTNATTVMIHNKTDANDMLSVAASIASGGTVGTVGTVNTSFDDVATNDVIRIDVDSVSTTAPKGLMVVLEFRLP